MPRKLSEYGARDWLRLRPLLHAIKQRRYRAIDERALLQPARLADLAALHQAVERRRVILTVAFNDPEGLSLHRALVRRYVAHDVHLIVDNSSDSAASSEIRRLAEKTGAHYALTPENPWTGRNGSRSHGFAMNWAWRFVLRPGEPAAFGFLDDDMYPTASVDPFALLEGRPFHGDIRRKEPGPADERWYLWAGYCFFDFASVRSVELDFGVDWFASLDTGGANWERLYKRHKAEDVPRHPVRCSPILPGVPIEKAAVEWRGAWLHEIGWMTQPEFRLAKQGAVRALLAPHLAVTAP